MYTSRRAIGNVGLGLVVGAVFLVACSPRGGQGNDAASVWSKLQLLGSEIEHYEDLASMFASADVVVWATIAGVEEGRVFGGEEEGTAEYLALTLDVKEEFLDRVGDDTFLLELLMPDPSAVAALEAGLRGQEGVFFLRNKGLEAAGVGLPKEVQDTESQFYRFVNSQGFFLNQAGTVVAPLVGEEPSDFTQGLEGLPFQDLLGRVRAMS